MAMTVEKAKYIKLSPPKSWHLDKSITTLAGFEQGNSKLFLYLLFAIMFGCQKFIFFIRDGHETLNNGLKQVSKDF